MCACCCLRTATRSRHWPYSSPITARLLRAGCQIYERAGWHPALQDRGQRIGVWSIVGSSNFDHRSVLFNDEVDAVVIGSRTGAQLQQYFTEGLAHAHAIDAADLATAPVQRDAARALLAAMGALA